MAASGEFYKILLGRDINPPSHSPTKILKCPLCDDILHSESEQRKHLQLHKRFEMSSFSEDEEFELFTKEEIKEEPSNEDNQEIPIFVDNQNIIDVENYIKEEKSEKLTPPEMQTPDLNDENSDIVSPNEYLNENEKTIEDSSDENDGSRERRVCFDDYVTEINYDTEDSNSSDSFDSSSFTTSVRTNNNYIEEHKQCKRFKIVQYYQCEDCLRTFPSYNALQEHTCMPSSP